MPLGFFAASKRHLMLTVRKNAGVCGLSGSLVNRVVVRCAFEFDHRRVEFLALEQRLGEQEVRIGAVRLSREVAKILAIPASCLVIIAKLAIALCLCMIILCEVVQVCLQVCRYYHVFRRLIVQPETAIQAVAIDKILLALEHQAREFAQLVGFDYLNLQQRRLGMVGVSVDKGFVGSRRIHETLLLQVKIA